MGGREGGVRYGYGCPGSFTEASKEGMLRVVRKEGWKEGGKRDGLILF